MEFAIYLKNNHLKVVNEGSNIAEKDEMVISKLEYSELLDLKLKMLKEIQSVKAKCTSLEQR